MSWQREFGTSPLTRSPFPFAIVLFFLFGGGAVVFLIAALYGGPVCGTLLLMVFLAFVGLMILAWYFSTEWWIVCNQSGFSVTISSRAKGIHRHEDYRWSEVIKTEEGFIDKSAGDVDSYWEYLKVETMQGEAFEVSVTYGTPGFRDLIQLFNQMTPHLPYTSEKDSTWVGIWGYKHVTQRQGGIPESSSAGPADEGRERIKLQ